MALKDKAKIEKLLKVYSTKDISKTFIHIDEKMASLHECSTNDFSQLNKDFKSLFNQLKVITDNINDIISYFNQDESIELFESIKAFANELYSSLIKYKNQWENHIQSISRISDQLEILFFPVKNATQNLMILKYLLTNLKILIPTNVANKKENQLSEKEIDLLINKINLNFNQINNNLVKANDLKAPNINALGVTLLDIINKVNELERIYKNNKNCFIELKKKKLDTDGNISDIVKKLQYHDIIRQKMEHIQKTHQDLIEELNMFNVDDNDEKSLVQKAKYYLKIRDVSGIQAAQLIQANKEYQNAIETIVNNFIHVLSSIDDLKKTCNNTSDDDSNGNFKIYDQLIKRIETVEGTYSIELDKYNSLGDNTVLIKNKVDRTGNYVKKLQAEIYELKILVKGFLKNTLSKLDTDENIQKTEKQVYNVLVELENNSESLVGLVDELGKDENINILESHNKEILKKQNFRIVKTTIDKLQDNRNNIEQKLQENKTIGNKSLNQIRKSISDIKYYEYFEKVIEEITVELNRLSLELKKNDSLDSDSLSNNLSKLKEYYTVETEHKIHENIEKGKDDDIENKEDGEIEFF